jgi:hypothetical protein
MVGGVRARRPSREPTVEARYTVELSDHIEFMHHFVRRSGAGRVECLFAVGVCLLVFAVSVAGLYWWADNLLVRLVAFLFASGSVFAAVAYPLRYRGALERKLLASAEKMDRRGVLGTFKLILSEESLTEITEVSRIEVKWADVVGAEEVGERTFVYLGGWRRTEAAGNPKYVPVGGGPGALILPRLGFDSDEEYKAVRDFVMRKLAECVRT